MKRADVREGDKETRVRLNDRKKYKAGMLIGLGLMMCMILPLWMPYAYDEWGKMAGWAAFISGSFFVLGLGVTVVSAFLSWWHHG
ncbi:MAG TPA: hypothetical protein ENH62_00835 [Marinobacter sp.]|uniref:Uncharacterized protein n=1 Tax=marine sediment metagenome TaxID=412755 RepID=A0A0F9TQJ0_9ZZZZ|nr:hypothetical protein [Marinobacter sp.]